MGEVRNHTSLYFPSISSIWPIAMAGGTSSATIRSISGAAPFCQQHLPGQHRLPTSASNICPGHQHLPATSADICWSSALNLNSQHLNGPSIWAKHLKHLSQHLNGPSISIPLLGRPSIYFGRRAHLVE